MTVRNYKELVAWQKSMDLVEWVYQVTKKFPRDELYGLTNQIRRAVVSVASNIAEGQGRQTTKEFLNFLSMAYGSLMEVETQTMIASRLRYVDQIEEQTGLSRIAEVARLLNGLRKSLEKS